MSKNDRRANFSEVTDAEVAVPETAPEPATVAEAPPVAKEAQPEAVQPLKDQYFRMVAEKWPTTPQAKLLLDKLPQGLSEMLSRQSPEFLAGFANAVQCIHDMSIKVLLEDTLKRAKLGAPTVQDNIVIRAATLIEGFGYMACRAYVEKIPEGPDENKSPQ